MYSPSYPFPFFFNEELFYNESFFFLCSLDDFPNRIQEKLKALHMTGNEFLKHYYSSFNRDKQKKLIERLKSTLKQIDNFHTLSQEDETSDNSQIVSEETWRESLRIAQDVSY